MLELKKLLVLLHQRREGSLPNEVLSVTRFGKQLHGLVVLPLFDCIIIAKRAQLGTGGMRLQLQVVHLSRGIFDVLARFWPNINDGKLAVSFELSLAKWIDINLNFSRCIGRSQLILLPFNVNRQELASIGILSLIVLQRQLTTDLLFEEVLVFLIYHFHKTSFQVCNHLEVVLGVVVSTKLSLCISDSFNCFGWDAEPGTLIARQQLLVFVRDALIFLNDILWF